MDLIKEGLERRMSDVGRIVEDFKLEINRARVFAEQVYVLLTRPLTFDVDFDFDNKDDEI